MDRFGWAAWSGAISVWDWLTRIGAGLPSGPARLAPGGCPVWRRGVACREAETPL